MGAKRSRHSDTRDSLSEGSEVSVTRRDQDDNTEIRPQDSVSNVGSEEGAEVSSALDSDYHEVISELISVLGINSAQSEAAAEADILSSRVRDKKSKVYLPLAQTHRNLIDKVWQNDTASISVFKQSVTERYHITEDDFDKYCRVGSLDKILAHALRKNGVTSGTSKSKTGETSLKIPIADNAKLESRAWRIERESLAGIACTSVQSWLLQFLSKKLEVLDGFLRETFPDAYESILSATGCHVLPKSLLLAQDAALDQLDLFARVAANAKSQRRLLWLQPSPWSKQLKDMVMRFPIEGGLVCGSKLLDTLEECKNFDEALERVETPSTSKQGQQGPRGHNPQPNKQNAPPAKRSRPDPQPAGRSNYSSDRGARGGRGNPRPSTSSYSYQSRERSQPKNWQQGQKKDWSAQSKPWDRSSKFQK